MACKSGWFCLSSKKNEVNKVFLATHSECANPTMQPILSKVVSLDTEKCFPTFSRGLETQAQRKTAHKLNLRTSWQRTFQIEVSQAIVSTPACLFCIRSQYFPQGLPNQPQILIATENLTNIKAKFWVSRVLSGFKKGERSRLRFTDPRSSTKMSTLKRDVLKTTIFQGTLLVFGGVYSLSKLQNFQNLESSWYPHA